ncbi:MAG TPA: UDP-N-acetylmuramoyl-L-alanine--D-glutamate ligase [Gaiellaceae bacterium]|nr:UDP-N-acetylmuramoyl-L-alanine--D-glutamate ligase [Gaiellaceae bacterium]
MPAASSCTTGTRLSSLPESALVLGLARSGEAAALALARRGVRVVGVDRNAELEAGRLRAAGVEVVLGAEDPALVEDVDLLVKSPGVPSEVPLVAAARRRGLTVWSEVELGSRLLPNPVLGVTGTNGKTTTSELLGAIFRAAERPVAVAGNVGRPLTGLDGALADGAWIVCELSSFQLEDLVSFRPRVAVLLNLTPDHLDRHGDLDGYRAAKLRIFENQREDDVAVLPRGFEAVPGEARRIEFAADDPLPAEPRIPGEHNRENAAAATAAARAAGIPDTAIAEGLRTFAGVPHRLELVRELDGVRWINDSKATNPEAAERALGAYPPGLRVILGGSRKHTPFGGLARGAALAGVSCAYLIGESADEIAEALAREGVRFRHSRDLESAVRDAREDAEPGDVVLLSPACASYDQFRDFEERGEQFRELVEAL